ncbi:MAG: hypothetical protein ACRD0K_12085 [Egibacteraceae bacterium]
MTKLRQSSPNGTVRSTALRVRLRAWPTPAVCLAWQDRDLARPPGRVPGDDVDGGTVQVGGGQREPLRKTHERWVLAVNAIDDHARGRAD